MHVFIEIASGSKTIGHELLGENFRKFPPNVKFPENYGRKINFRTLKMLRALKIDWLSTLTNVRRPALPHKSGCKNNLGIVEIPLAATTWQMTPKTVAYNHVANGIVLVYTERAPRVGQYEPLRLFLFVDQSSPFFFSQRGRGYS